MRHILSAAALIAACLGGAACISNTDDEATETIPHRLGFTGAANLPNDPIEQEELLESLGLSDEIQFDEAILAHMEALSGLMARVEFFYLGNGEFVHIHESLSQKMLSAGFEIYGCINPISPAEGLDSAYDAALTDLVEMHPQITHWQIGNEPDLLWTDHSKFPAFFLRSQPLVRAACPSCKILLAGISNQYDTSSESHQRYESFLEEIAAAELSGRAFDVFDMHYYKEKPAASEIAQAVSDLKALLEKHGLAQGVTFWCTETGLYTGDPPSPDLGPRTEEEQASDLARMVAWMSAAGIQRIFFWTLIEGYAGAVFPGFFDSMGLIYDGLGEESSRGIAGGTKKKAYTTYGLLGAALKNTSSPSKVSAGVYRFEGSQGPVFIIWDEGRGGSVSLTEISAPSVLVEDLVPDSQAETQKETLTVSHGGVTVTVGQSPKLVTVIQ